MYTYYSYTKAPCKSFVHLSPSGSSPEPPGMTKKLLQGALEANDIKPEPAGKKDFF